MIVCCEVFSNHDQGQICSSNFTLDLIPLDLKVTTFELKTYFMINETEEMDFVLLYKSVIIFPVDIIFESAVSNVR